MYFGIGGKTDPKAQQSSHVMDNSQNSLRGSQISSAPQRPVVDTHQEVQAFQRKLQFEQFKKAGMSIREAVYRIGNGKVPMGANLTPKDITQVIETGGLQKKKI